MVYRNREKASSASLHDMRLDEPKRLVERTRIACQYVGGIRVAGLVASFDSGAHGIGGLAVTLRQRFKMILDLRDVERIGFERRRLSTACVDPSATPPSWTTRSAIVSTWVSISARKPSIIS